MDDGCRIYKEHPIIKSNFISKLFMCWIVPIFKHGRKKPLEQNDLYSPIPEHRSEYLTDLLELEWNKELKKKTPSLVKALIRIFYKRVLILAIVPLLSEISIAVLPLFFLNLMEYFNDKISRYDAYKYGSIICAITLISSVMYQPFLYRIYTLGLEVRTTLSGLLYRKTLKIQSMGNNSGNLMNLLSNDTSRVEASIILMPALIIAPVDVVLILYIMFKMANITVVGGLVIIVVIIIIQTGLGKVLNNYRRKTSEITDRRINLTTEILNGIKVIKMYCWEEPFKKIIENLRKNELKSQGMVFFIAAVYATVDSEIPTIVTYISVVTFIFFINAHLSPSYLVIIMNYYGLLCNTIGYFIVEGVSALISARVSIMRIQEYMMQPEHSDIESNKTESNTNIKVVDLNADWNDENKKSFSLKNITFEVQSNELIMIVGGTGSGKTSLLMALLNEIPNRKGDIKINGSMFYVSQEPWIFTGTIKQNILFGKEYDKEKFKKIIRLSALTEDIKQFPNGKYTIIGDKGINLSGGQKARVSLARALYNDPDIYIFDDPLSAVDANVGRFIFDECIHEYLKSKIRVLVTHQIQYLTGANKIIVLNQGEVQAQGAYDDTVNKTSLDLNESLNENKKDDKDVSEIKNYLKERRKSSSSIGLSRQTSKAYSYVNSNEENDYDDEYEEKRETGTLKISNVAKLFNKGIIFLILILLMFILTQVFLNISEYWLSFWANEEQDAFDKNQTLSLINENLTHYHNDTALYLKDKFIPFENRQLYFYIASLIIGIYIFMFTTRSALYFIFSLFSSKTFHYKMLDCVMHKKMRFFDLNPIGRIINRFSKDVGVLDDGLPIATFNFLQPALQVVGAVVVSIYINYWIALTLIPIAVLFLYLRKFYISSSRQLKRLEGLSRSEIYVHVQNTINGLAAIRCCKNEKIIKNEYDGYFDFHTQVCFTYIAAARWFALILDFANQFFTIVFIYGCILAKHSLSITPGQVGLALSYIMNVLQLFQYVVRQSTEVENMATSLERIAEYSDKKEENLHESLKKPPENWPKYGEIVFDNVSFSYDEHLPSVLKNITIKINSKEKIGVVGRTGAGKSSFFHALLRTAENSGAIKIDGIDTKDISLFDLRNHISIIPQDPTLFYGTLRYNLDPFLLYSDKDIWEALDSVQLKETVQKMEGKLESNMQKQGSNFSVGQKQLLCLARAILRKSKILIVDEATANVDLKTDYLVQKAIRTCFKSCTVITIAHRLNTIIDSDRILCLSHGQVVNFGIPYDLLQDPTSLFYELVKKLGDSEFERMFDLSKAHLINSDNEMIDENDLDENLIEETSNQNETRKLLS